MIESLFTWIGGIIINTIETTGYWGIALFMGLESANIPIPSEIIMPFSGYLVFQESLNFFWVILWGTVGNLLGSLLSYYLGYVGGRPFLLKYGKFLFISSHDVELSEKLFQRYGSFAILFSRVLPVVRTFISFPAGIAKMNIWKFSLYTFIGSFLWTWVLTYAGVLAGDNWNLLETYFKKFDWIILLFLILLGVWWIWRHVKAIQKQQ